MGSIYEEELYDLYTGSPSLASSYPRDSARKRLRHLTNHEFLELLTHVNEELSQRNSGETNTKCSNPSALGEAQVITKHSRRGLHRRQQAMCDGTRQAIAMLSTERLHDCMDDVESELVRRYNTSPDSTAIGRASGRAQPREYSKARTALCALFWPWRKKKAQVNVPDTLLHSSAGAAAVSVPDFQYPYVRVRSPATASTFSLDPPRLPSHSANTSITLVEDIRSSPRSFERPAASGRSRSRIAVVASQDEEQDDGLTLLERKDHGADIDGPPLVCRVREPENVMEGKPVLETRHQDVHSITKLEQANSEAFLIPIRPERATALKGVLATRHDIHGYSFSHGRLPTSTHRETEIISLQKDRCQTVVDALHFALGNDPAARKMLARQLVKICVACDVVPSGLFVLHDSVQMISREPVAFGGYADIYQGIYHDTVKVAAKRFRMFAGGSPSLVYRKFWQELILWQFLDHKYILPFYGVDGHTFHPLFCMLSPWMEHGHMQDYFDIHKPDLHDTNRFLVGVAEGLRYLHRQDIVHGDLRSANILVDEKGNPRLTDFGLSTLVEEAPSTATGSQTAMRWCAPELFEPDEHRTVWSDVWAFGCVCLEGYTGKMPFPLATRDPAVLRCILKGGLPGDPSVLDSRGKRLPDDLWEFMEVCWKAEPFERPHSAHLPELLIGFCAKANEGDFDI